LVLYWNGSRQDNCCVSSAEGHSVLAQAGYQRIRSECKVLRHQAPGTVPLNLFWHPTRNDHFTAASQDAMKDCARDGYFFVRCEGYVY